MATKRVLAAPRTATLAAPRTAMASSSATAVEREKTTRAQREEASFEKTKHGGSIHLTANSGSTAATAKAVNIELSRVLRARLGDVVQRLARVVPHAGILPPRETRAGDRCGSCWPKRAKLSRSTQAVTRAAQSCQMNAVLALTSEVVQRVGGTSPSAIGKQPRRRLRACRCMRPQSCAIKALVPTCSLP
eukprot:2571609-Pleurochrysis_carterae.AAC.1